MDISIACSMCGVNELEHSFDLREAVPSWTVYRMIEEAVSQHDGWSVQKNGVDIDVYCSAECAA